MAPLTRRLLRALMGAQAGGFLAAPPGFDGRPGLGIAALSGIPRAREWDAVASARAPELRGDQVHFVALADGTLVVDEAQPEGSVAPLADEIEKMLRPPYRAVGERRKNELWVAGALRVETVELGAALTGDTIELSSYEGARELLVDGRPSTLELPQLERDGDYVVRAERLTETTWVADVQAL
jgi:hypothetical protein